MPGGQRSQHAAVRSPLVTTATNSVTISNGASAVVAGSSNGFLLVSGGLDRHDVTLSSLLAYYPLSDTWEERGSLPCQRADHVMLTWKDKVGENT